MRLYGWREMRAGNCRPGVVAGQSVWYRVCIHSDVPSSGPSGSSFLSSSTLIVVCGAKAAFFVGRSPPWSFRFRFFSATAMVCGGLG